MAMIAVLSALFFFGYLVMRDRWQALMFLAIGAGYQLLMYSTDQTGQAGLIATVAISMASALGYVAWSSSRKVADGRPYGLPRLVVFVGFAVNWALAIWLLWLTGTIDFIS
jgi:hypothetical protein